MQVHEFWTFWVLRSTTKFEEWGLFLIILFNCIVFLFFFYFFFINFGPLAKYSRLKEERLKCCKNQFFISSFLYLLGEAWKPRHFVKTKEVHATTITEWEIWHYRVYSRLLERYLQRVLIMAKVLFARRFS